MSIVNKSHDYPGFFVAVEGLDGAGKTTLIDNLRARFSTYHTDADVYVCQDPGTTRVGLAIRQMVKSYGGLSTKTQTLLFGAARSAMIDGAIRPALEAGKIIICDRYELSTYAYQCPKEIEDYDNFYSVCDFATQGLKPDLYLFVDIDPEECANRIIKRTTDDDDRWTSVATHIQRRALYEIWLKSIAPCHALIRSRDGKEEEMADEAYKLLIEHIKASRKSSILEAK